MVIAAATAIVTATRFEIIGRSFLFPSVMSSPFMLLAVFAAWFVLNRYILPRFGIAT